MYCSIKPESDHDNLVRLFSLSKKTDVIMNIYTVAIYKYTDKTNNTAFIELKMNIYDRMWWDIQKYVVLLREI